MNTDQPLCTLCNHAHGVNQYCLTLVQREVPASGTTQALTFTKTMICGCPSAVLPEPSTPVDEAPATSEPQTPANVEVNLNLTSTSEPLSDTAQNTPPPSTPTIGFGFSG